MGTWLLWLRLWWGAGADLCHLQFTVLTFSCPEPSSSLPARLWVKVPAASASLTPFQPRGPPAVPHTGQACSGLRAFALHFFGLECYSHKVVLTLFRFVLTCHLRREVPPTTLSGRRPSDRRFPYPAGAGVCACIFLQGTWPSLTLFYIGVCLMSVPPVCKLPDSGTRSVFCSIPSAKGSPRRNAHLPTVHGDNLGSSSHQALLNKSTKTGLKFCSGRDLVWFRAPWITWVLELMRLQLKLPP